MLHGCILIELPCHICLWFTQTHLDVRSMFYFSNGCISSSLINMLVYGSVVAFFGVFVKYQVA